MSIVCLPQIRITALTALIAFTFASSTLTAQVRPNSPARAPDFIGQISGNQMAELTGADGRMHFFVELEGMPAARAWAERMDDFAQNNAAARSAAAIASREQVRANQSAQAAVQNQLFSGAIGAQEVYRLSKVANGFVVRAEPGKFAAMSRLAGVRTVHVVYPEVPTNSTSVPFIDAPQAWGDTLGLGVDLTGTGVSIGIIDTGIDYQHSNFGGTGILADYTANDRTVAPDAYFPTAKVVGGVDLAGDTYNASGNGGTTGSTTPAPDPDPMDCNRHGSHVAGTAGGLGVNADGTTFAGPWDENTPFAGMRIGPGVAPRSQLYAIRVFGCQGSTSLTPLGIEWSTDPNGDNDFSDRLDVINMSLGSNLGGVNDITSIASDNAALVGVFVVASAGNAGDTAFITGSPGAAGRALSVASSLDDGLAGAFLTVNSPAGIAGGYAAAPSAYTDPTAPPPPVASGQTANVVLVDDGVAPLSDGCTAFTNAAAIAGNIALVDRGVCNFNVKVQFAQAAGAIGVIVGNNVVGDPIPNVMGGAATIEITIPAISVSQATRAAIATALGSGAVNVTLNSGNAGDTMSAFSSRGARRASSPIKLKPEVSAPGQNITSVQTGVSFAGGSCVPTCNVSLANAGLNSPLVLSGTSMAAPHMAGVIALLRQQNPTWSVEELKALAMNYSTHDVRLGANNSGPRFSLSRMGAGRIDVAKAAAGQVIAMSKDDPGLVSVTFDREVVANANLVRTVRVVNHGDVAQTYNLAIDPVVDAPGVVASLPGGSTLTVPAGGTVEFTLQLAATANSMDNRFDDTQAAGQAVTAPAGLAGLGALPRHRLTEETGFVTLSQAGNLQLRVPYYSAPRPASQMAGGSIVTGGAPTGSTTIPLSGVDVCTGTLGAGPSCTGSFPTDEVSLVSPFELQLISPRNPNLALADSHADIQYVGVAADVAGTNIYFGVSSWAHWSSPNETVYNIWIDNNEDGVWDHVVFNGSVGQVSSRLFGANENAQDNFLSFRFTPPGTVGSQFFINSSPATVDTDLQVSGVQVIPVLATAIGLTAGNNNFRYRVESCPWFAPLCSALPAFVPNSGFDNTGPGFASWDRTARGLDFGGNFLYEDLNGDSLPVTWNTANLTANGSAGALLLHHLNTEGTQAQVVLLDTAASADLSISKSMAPVNPSFGQNATFTITVTNNGPGAASAISVLDALPAGLLYVSDNGAGAYVPSTGVWTVGALANGASATLQVVATVQTSNAVYNTATISAATPLDSDPSDNQSTVIVNAEEVADLALSLSASSPTVQVGAPFTITLTATNSGADSAFSVAVNELFTGFEPLAPTAINASAGVYNPATGLWNIASLSNGGSATLALTFTAPNMAGTLTNNATLGSSVADPNNANNAASAAVTVLSPASVSSTKTVAGSFIPGGTVTYTVVLNNSAAFDQQNNPGDEFVDVLPAQLSLVSVSASSGTAVNSGNTASWNGVVPANGSVTITITASINPGTPAQSISNQGTINSDADGNGSNELTSLTDDPSLAGVSDPTVFGIIGVSINDAAVTEGTGAGTTNAVFTVSISEQPPVGPALVVNYASAGGTATSGTDFTATAGSLSFSNGGPLTQTISVPIARDDIDENNENFTVVVSSAGAVLTDAQGDGTINDDDGVPTATLSNQSVTEGNAGLTPVTFTVTLSNPSAFPLSFPVSTTDGSAVAPADYVNASGTTVNFAPLQTTSSFTVNVVGESLVEPNESFMVSLASGRVGIPSPSATVTIVNDDSATLSISDVTLPEGSGNGQTPFSFTVTTNNPSSLPITVNYQTNNGTAIAPNDYTAASGTLTIPALATSAPIIINVLADNTFEANETFTVTLSAAQGATIGDATGLGTIVQDDQSLPIPTLDTRALLLLMSLLLAIGGFTLRRR